MKIHYLTPLLLLVFTLNLNAAVTIGPLSNDDPTDLTEIFYSDFESDLLYIDFKAVGDRVTQLNILKDDNLMMEDDVTDLPDNTIYELNLDVLRQGNYTVELVCEQGITIRKRIVIE